jgi:hypothetical protein
MHEQHRGVRFDFGKEFAGLLRGAHFDGNHAGFFPASSLQAGPYTMWLTDTLCVPPFDLFNSWNVRPLTGTCRNSEISPAVWGCYFLMIIRVGYEGSLALTSLSVPAQGLAKAVGEMPRRRAHAMIFWLNVLQFSLMERGESPAVEITLPLPRVSTSNPGRLRAR